MKKVFTILLLLVTMSLQGQDSFSHQPEDKHYLVVLPKAGWADMKDMLGGFAKYNAKKYAERGLQIKQYRLSEAHQMPFVLVGVFNDETDAMLYFQGLKSPPALFLQMGVAEDYFIISAGNYRKVLKKKSFSEYQEYFKKKYPE